MRLRRSTIFTDPRVELTRGQKQRGLANAQSAAREAQQTLTLTKKKQYRRYRAVVGDTYLDWPRWKAEYVRAYRRRITLEPAQARHEISNGMGSP